MKCEAESKIKEFIRIDCHLVTGLTAGGLWFLLNILKLFGTKEAC